jgi:hypothetical protein
MFKKTGRGHGSKLKVAHFFRLMLPAPQVFDGIRGACGFIASAGKLARGGNQ